MLIWILNVNAGWSFDGTLTRETGCVSGRKKGVLCNEQVGPHVPIIIVLLTAFAFTNCLGRRLQ